MARNNRDYLPANLPRINIPFAVAKQRYGREVADLMARKAQSVAEAAKRMNADEFKWTLEYAKADDPKTDDPKEFAELLADHSLIYLVARGGNWKGWERIGIVPPQVMVRFEERAKLVCRRHENQPTEPEAQNAEAGSDLVTQLDEWAEAHSGYDQRLYAIARLALQGLTA